MAVASPKGNIGSQGMFLKSVDFDHKQLLKMMADHENR